MSSQHYYLQAMPGLGQQSRTFGAIALGGSRAGAGSAVRIYNFYQSTAAIRRPNYFRNLNTRAQALPGFNIQNGYLSLLHNIG